MIYTSKIFGATCYFYTTKEQNCIKTPFIWLRKTKKSYYVCGLTTIIDSFIPTKYKKGFENEKLAFSYLKQITIMINKFDTKLMKKYCMLNPFGTAYAYSYLLEFNATDRLTKVSKEQSIKPKRSKK